MTNDPFQDILTRLGGDPGAGPDAGAGDASSRSAVGRILDSLRRRIIAMDLPPDTVLSRVDLARAYQVSQTPVREALQRLESEGLVLIFPQSRTLVTRIDTDKIHEAHFLRRAVEVEVIRLLARAPGPALIARLRTILTLQETLAADRDAVSAFQHLDEAFHQTLIVGAGQPGLHGLIRAQSGHLNRVRRLDMPDNGKIGRILDGHRQILAALERGSEDAAVAAMRDHLSQTIDRIEVLRAQYPAFFKPKPGPAQSITAPESGAQP